jgi:hypothetical protein
MKPDRREGHIFDVGHYGMTRAEFDQAFDDLCRTFLVEPDSEFAAHESFSVADSYAGPDWRVTQASWGTL